MFSWRRVAAYADASALRVAESKTGPPGGRGERESEGERRGRKVGVSRRHAKGFEDCRGSSVQLKEVVIHLSSYAGYSYLGR